MGKIGDEMRIRMLIIKKRNIAGLLSVGPSSTPTLEARNALLIVVRFLQATSNR
jgi:hypothetical protein